MRALIIASMVTLVTGPAALPSEAGTMAHYWSLSGGGPAGAIAFDVATGPGGEIFVVGAFSGVADFGGGDLFNEGSDDIFLVKYDRFGAHQWSQSFGGTGQDRGFGVAVDNLGNVFITGEFRDQIELGGASLISAGQSDIFIAKYNSAGSHQWSSQYGGPGNDHGVDIAVTTGGSSYITGRYEEDVDMGGGTLPGTGTVGKVFLARYDSFGTHMWSLGLQGANTVFPGGLAIAATGHVALCGDFWGTVDFGAGAVAAVGNADMFLSYYDPSGNYVWSHQFGAGGRDVFNEVTIDAAGDIVVVGDFGSGTINLGGEPMTAIVIQQPVFAKFNSAGSHQWSFHGTGQALPLGVDTDSDGNVVVAGYFGGNIDIGGGTLTSSNDSDVFVARYGPDGTHQWSNGYGGFGPDAAWSIAIDIFGHPVAAGSFETLIDFGGGSHGSVGGLNIWIAKWFSEIEIGALDDEDDDRGRVAAMFWVKHVLDGPPLPIDPPQAPITHYSIWRAVDVPPMYPPDPIHGCMPTAPGEYRALSECGWERVADIAATGNEGYMALVPTTRDASPGDPAVHYFVILAEDDEGGFRVSPAQSVSTINQLGSVVLSVDDVPNDQGRRVNISFTRDSEDQAGATTPVWTYEVYRRDDAPPEATAPALRAEKSGGEGGYAIDGWTFVASTPAHGDSIYSVEAPTVGDSTISAGEYLSTFFVRATTVAPTVFYDSSMKAGYSLDNLAPEMPANVAFNAGVLSWDPSQTADFDYFTVYGSNSGDFVTAVVVDYTTGESMDVTASGYAWFYVTATDFSGNEGPYGSLWTVTGTGGTPANHVLSLNNHPNPFNPGTVVRYSVPERGMVSVRIYDARGALVNTLVQPAMQDAGAYHVEWDGYSDNGTAVSSGVYFARIEHPAGTRTRKMVLLK